jgi:N-acetylmuramoyl-L-alanine amidase-like protein
VSIRFLPPALADTLRSRGLKVVEVPGWQTRSRPASAGSFNPVGQLWHHTGSKDTNPLSIADDRDYAEWLAEIGRSDLAAPLCQTSVGRDGTVYVCAAGRGNHAGSAKASGPIAAGDGNALYVGHECQNTGTEGWPKSQYEAMVLLGATMAVDVLHCSAQAQRGHKETSVTGKWDPGALDMDRFRDDLADKMVDLIQDDHPPHERTPVEEARELLQEAIEVATRRGKTERVKKLRATLNRLPKR